MDRLARRGWLAGFLVAISGVYAEASSPEPSIATERTDPASVVRYGPAYRYPRAGWVVVHVEGAPYERGYQHGRLLAGEIADYIKTLATKRSASAPGDAWRETRTMVNALFLRKYDKEYLEEMKGIADGASAAGATFQGRALDLLDVATLNSDIELEFLDSALEATANGLEGRVFREPAELTPSPAPPEHCSAFAATGEATADGKIVIGHITMFSLTFVRHFNVWLDVKPEKGHRVLMQTSPGGIQSGMDYYLNDAGLIVAETTIKQTKFEASGLALASRIRKALQYSETIDQAVAILKEGNNGMYTNEWLLADTKTNEIAMFELGTQKSKLWRSSKDEWFGGTKGFYWGCNNAKDLDVRLETIPSVEARPENVVWHPSDRDRAWLRLYEMHKGKIGTGFGFEAFTTAPLAAFPSCDAKFTTTEMAKELKTWALFGPPLGKTWEPSEWERKRFAEVQPLHPNDWTVLSAEAPAETASEGAKALMVDAPSAKAKEEANDDPHVPHPATWHGTILAKREADTWLAAAFADYERIVGFEKSLKAKAKAAKRVLNKREKEEIEVDLFGPYSRYRAALVRRGKEDPLAATQMELTHDEWYQSAASKGVLLLVALREKLGDDKFLAFMDAFGRNHAGKAASTEEFVAAAEAIPGSDLKGFFRSWLEQKGLPDERETGFWSVDSYDAELARSVIVYGTSKESDSQREAGHRLQRLIERKWSNITVPVMSDVEYEKGSKGSRHLLIVGRPDTNSVARRMASAIALKFGTASFVLQGETYANPLTAVIAAGANPVDSRCEVVFFSGLSAEATRRCVEAVGERDGEPSQVLLMPAGGKARRMVVEGPKRRDAKAASLR